MKSTCTTKKREQLVQVEWKWCDKINKNNLKHKLYTTRNLWEEAPPPSLQYILCLSVGMTSKCDFSLGFPSGSPKIGTLAIPKLQTFISFSNQVCFFGNAMAMPYSLQKDLSNGVQHTPIRAHLTLTFKGFMVKSQIPNFTSTLSFYHNSCKLGLNEQCKGTLSIYVSIPF